MSRLGAPGHAAGAVVTGSGAPAGLIREAVTRSLTDTLARSLDVHGIGPGSKAVVAVSGGLDSSVLLHLLRFAPFSGPELAVAHFDHAMRADGVDDAYWVRGLCRAWRVHCTVGRAARAPRNEEEARDARYAFLERTRVAEGADMVLTAHHADDQAETVLFRVLRGTGVRGLAGIPAVRAGTVVRPLLERWRHELEAHARRVGLAWRDDATNDAVSPARNAIRHLVLPGVEASFAPGARRALVRLAGLAAADEEAWDAVLPRVLEDLDVREGPDGVSVDRESLLALAPPLQARVLRAIASRFGVALDEAATGRAVDFGHSGRSGGAIPLGAGLELRRRLRRLAVLHPEPPGPDRPVTIPAAGRGSAVALLAGRSVRVLWSDGGAPGPCTETLEVPAGRLPLVVRSCAPGDRIRLAGGTKKLKKLLLEARIPADLRGRVPVVADRHGTVLWVPGVARAVDLGDEPDGPKVTIGVER